MAIERKHILCVDNFFATILVLVILKYFLVFFDIDMFDPIQNTFEDMQITDLFFSQIRDYSQVPIDSNIILINNGHLDRKNVAKMINILNQY